MKRGAVALLAMLLGCAKQSSAPAEPPNPVAPAHGIPGGVPGGIPAPPRIETTTTPAGKPSPEQAARVEAIRDRGLARLTRDARYKAELMRQIEGVTDVAVARERGRIIGMILSSRGMPRLSDAMLERWMLIRAQLNLSSEDACAALWGGPMSEDTLTLALASLDDDTLADFVHIIAEASLAELSATTPLVQDHDGLKLGITALQDQLTPDDRERFAAILAGTRTTPSDQCFASRVLHDRVGWIPPEVRVRFIRALAASMAAP
jgi:hypothetical protein